MRHDPFLDRRTHDETGTTFFLVGICLTVALMAVGVMTAVAISHSLS